MTPELCYLVCATPRSGSTLLCELLEQTGVAGRPDEYFEALRHSGVPRRPHEYFDPELHPDIVDRLAFREMPDRPPTPNPLWAPDTYDRYLAWALEEGTTPNGVFGAKIMWGYLEDFVALMRRVEGFAELPVPEVLDWAFPGLRYVRITRRDKARQAVSLWKAVQTQDWKREADDDGARASAVPTFSFSAVDHLVHQLIAHDAAWDGFFMGMGLDPLVVTYEELAEAHEPVVRRVLAHIGVPAPDPLGVDKPRLAIQADRISEEWTARYAELAGAARPA